MRALSTFFGLLALIVAAPLAVAQLEVSLSLERGNYVSLEAIEATVTVKNSVGKDVVLGGPGGNPWLNFQIHDTSGALANPIRAVNVQPMVLRNGESLQRKFQLDRLYYLSESGTYIIRAAAYFPELEKYNLSRPHRFNVQQPRPAKWQEVFAVPGGRGYRRFQIFTFNDTTKAYVCLSVIDEETKMVMSRTALGSVMVEKEIQPALDRNKHLHIVYLGTPTLYVYQQVDPVGNITDRKYYLAAKGVPKLIKNPDGSVLISGGSIYDPSLQPKGDSFRKLSDRPPGLPN
jgi:hypothetical protein